MTQRLRAHVPVIAVCGAVLCSAVAWLVRPGNQLGHTRPTTVWSSLAIGLAGIAIVVGAVVSRRAPRAASASIIVASVALLAALGALVSLTTLPYGD